MVCAHCLLMGTHIEHPRVSLHTAVTDRKAQVFKARRRVYQVYDLRLIDLCIKSI